MGIPHLKSNIATIQYQIIKEKSIFNMPRQPRVEDIGFHHLINRGVARCDIFLDAEDNIKFLDILQEAKERYAFTVHSLCLMDNHYHVLVETVHENLSLIARQINSKYAQYFNLKYKRVGPLWQGRFKNIYVFDESYLYELIRYIEQNPIRANITRKIGAYRWTASSFILNNDFTELLNGSILFDKNLFLLLDESLNDSELEKVIELEKIKYKKNKKKTIRLKQNSLEYYFTNIKNIKQRNMTIKAAVHDGYKQSEIAEYLGLSRTTVSKSIFSK